MTIFVNDSQLMSNYQQAGWSSVGLRYSEARVTDSSPVEYELRTLDGFRIKNQIRIQKEFIDDGTIVLKCRYAKIFSFGKTDDEAMKELSEQFSFQWKTFVETDISQLHESAIKRRLWLLDHLEKV